MRYRVVGMVGSLVAEAVDDSTTSDQVIWLIADMEASGEALIVARGRNLASAQLITTALNA
jgi:hypothetical protein